LYCAKASNDVTAAELPRYSKVSGPDAGWTCGVVDGGAEVGFEKYVYCRAVGACCIVECEKSRAAQVRRGAADSVGDYERMYLV
jgi:hypothetical protein